MEPFKEAVTFALAHEMPWPRDPAAEPDRADQTFSVAKTYLALLAGIAQDRGLLEPGERVADRLPGIGFDSAHNRAITCEGARPEGWEPSARKSQSRFATSRRRHFTTTTANKLSSLRRCAPKRMRSAPPPSSGRRRFKESRVAGEAHGSCLQGGLVAWRLRARPRPPVLRHRELFEGLDSNLFELPRETHELVYAAGVEEAKCERNS